jgi:hypothetical protein
MKLLEHGKGEKSMSLENFDREPKDKKPLGRPRSRWEGNAKVNLRDILRDIMGWILVDPDTKYLRAFVNTIMYLPFHN